jgi:hypothetical protein
VVYSKNKSCKVLERKTITTSRTLKVDFKRARESTIKRLVVKIFYDGEESAISKDLYFKDSVNWFAKKFLSTSSSFLCLSIKSSMNVWKIGRFGSEQFFL